MPSFFQIGLGLPFYNAVQGSRYIVMGSYDRIGRNVGANPPKARSSAQDPRMIRTRSVQAPHRIRTGSAQAPHRIRTGSAQLAVKSTRLKGGGTLCGGTLCACGKSWGLD